jgi:uncharacterized membrane-anchored protein
MGASMKNIAAFLALLCAICSSPTLGQPGEEIPPEIQKFLDSLEPLQGEIPLPEAQASLDLGNQYLFYNSQEAKAILVDLWGNPPDSVDGVLGLVMLADTTPLSDSWGAVISFEETGYVSDDDAADADYDEVMTQLQEGARSGNQSRSEAGYPTVDVVGWAERPNYDPATHSVVWAQNLRFSDSDVNTLNYDFRSLGRYGVLSMNLVSTTPELENVREAARDFATHAQFNAGARYRDFNASTDRVAEYGLGGLVAAGVGVAAAKKLGLLAIFAKFGKFIFLGIALLVGVFWRKIAGIFGAGQDDTEEEWIYEEEQVEGLEEADQPANVPADISGNMPDSDGRSETDRPA